MNIDIRTLENTPLEVISEAFNAAFCDYFLEVDLTPEELSYKIKAEHIDLRISPGVWVGDRLEGLILNASRAFDGKQTAYNAGTAVRPEQRRKGLARAMHDFILPRLKAHGFDRAILEVIDINTPAINAYEQVGYVRKRFLESWAGVPKTKESPHQFSFCEFRTIQEIAPFKVWWDVEPTWQHQFETAIQTWERQCALGIFDEKECVGYGLFAPSSGRVMQFAVSPNHRKNGVGTALLTAIQERSGFPLRIINVEQSEHGIGEFLYNLGFKKLLNQWEMELNLQPE